MLCTGRVQEEQGSTCLQNIWGFCPNSLELGWRPANSLCPFTTEIATCRDRMAVQYSARIATQWLKCFPVWKQDGLVWNCFTLVPLRVLERHTFPPEQLKPSTPAVHISPMQCSNQICGVLCAVQCSYLSVYDGRLLSTGWKTSHLFGKEILITSHPRESCPPRLEQNVLEGRCGKISKRLLYQATVANQQRLSAVSATNP